MQQAYVVVDMKLDCTMWADTCVDIEWWYVQKLEDDIGEREPSVKQLAATGKDLQDYCKGQCYCLTTLHLCFCLFLRSLSPPPHLSLSLSYQHRRCGTLAS